MRFSRRKFLSLSAAALLAPSLGSARTLLSGPAFGSGWHGVLGAPGNAGILEDVIAQTIGWIDELFSPYRGTSYLSRFNRAEGLDWQSVPGEFADLAAYSLALSERTKGAFDPTVGPLVNRFGFGPIRGQAGGVEGIEIRDRELRKRRPGLTLDLNGVAKGRALDIMVDRLARRGVRDVLLELGGEVRCLGVHPSGRPWQIGVEDPRPETDGIHRVIAPGLRAVATSGHATQSYGTVSHLIDPRLGASADPRLASVTVLAATAREADGLATALAAFGPVDGPAFAIDQRFDALFLLRDGAAITDLTTGAFSDFIQA